MRGRVSHFAYFFSKAEGVGRKAEEAEGRRSRRKRRRRRRSWTRRRVASSDEALPPPAKVIVHCIFETMEETQTLTFSDGQIDHYDCRFYEATLPVTIPYRHCVFDEFHYAIMHCNLDGCELKEETMDRIAELLNCKIYRVMRRSNHWCRKAVSKGEIEWLKHFVAHGDPLHVDVLVRAIEKDERDCFVFAIENGCPTGEPFPIMSRIDGEKSSYLCEEAAEHGRIWALEYLFSHGFPKIGAIYEAAAVGKKWLTTMTYLRSAGCPWNEEACITAAGVGDGEVLQWLHVHGCPWTDRAYGEAMQASTSTALVYLLDNCCPWPYEPRHNFFPDASIEKMAILHARCLLPKNILALLPRRIDLMPFLRSKGYEWMPGMYSDVILVDDVAVVKYLIENGCTPPPSEEDMLRAVLVASVRMVTTLHEAGCPWHEHAFAEALIASEAAFPSRGDEMILCLMTLHCPLGDSLPTAVAQAHARAIKRHNMVVLEKRQRR
ncbi:MAG: hypothetical protein WC483_00240 [Candidatus Paceibacterota bacterium]